MEFEKLIAERYSVRSFRQEHLSMEVIDRILSAGHLAPTGCNFQPQRILVLNTDASIEKLRACIKGERISDSKSNREDSRRYDS